MKGFIRRIYILGALFALAAALNTMAGLQRLDVALHREMERAMTFKLEHLISEISADLVSVRETLNHAESMVKLERDEGRILEFFLEVLTHHQTYLALFFGTPQNVSIYANPWLPKPDIDVRTRPWYQAAAQEGRLVFTEPYLDSAAERLVLTMAQPVYGEERELLGVLGIDKSLEGIADVLRGERASANGYSFLFDRTGKITVEPGNGFTVGEGGNLGTAVDVALFQNSGGMIKATLGGADGYLCWRELNGSGLLAGTFAPFSDFLDRRGQTVQLVTTTLLAFLVVFVLLFIFLRDHIIEPITELDRDIGAISVDEDPTYRLPIGAKKVFSQLRQTINLVLERTEEYLENITHQQEELNAAYEQLVAHEQQLQAQYKDIKQKEGRIRFLADHDTLTGLLNRRRFEEDLQGFTERGRSGAVFLLDIDDFKNINDTQGHIYGDKVLAQVASIFKQRLRANAVAYRFGGDEFLIIVDGEDDPLQIRSHLDRISRYLAAPTVIDGRRNHLTSSIGVVRYPSDGQTVQELLIKADIAMHNAKKWGKNRYVFFEGRMGATFSERVRIEGVLVEALHRGDFILHYQPVVEVSSGAITYFEALIRLSDYLVPPAVFIPIAEESDLILAIGRWVIVEAISQLVKWQSAGEILKPISINLSTKQFYDSGLVSFLGKELDKHGISPELLEMEITETVLIDNMPAALKIIEELKRLGIRLALDDFGTGYASMNYITRIPVDRIKLDRSMTERIGENMAVMKGLVAIAHGLNMAVVGEGVETKEEAQLMVEVGCDYLQGYLFSRPVLPLQIEQLKNVTYREFLGYGAHD